MYVLDLSKYTELKVIVPKRLHKKSIKYPYLLTFIQKLIGIFIFLIDTYILLKIICKTGKQSKLKYIMTKHC